MEISKEEFLRQFGDDYGYPNSPKNIDEIRATEFKRLEGQVYLDHAGATLYSESQMQSVVHDLTSNVYGNPHSQSDSSMATSDMISAARQQVLDYLNASPKEYKCIFTSGATAALKLVGELFPWSRESCYAYTMENHNSVLGIREYALDQGATSVAVDVEVVEHGSRRYGTIGSSIQITKQSVLRRCKASSQKLIDINPSGNCYNLFAFPSECNFSGAKYPLDLVNLIKDNAGEVLEGSPRFRGQWLVLIDAAKGCSTEPPNLARYPADFVVFSFYKIFGYPTGLGALVVRTEAGRSLKKKYFSGGTVSASVADIDLVNRRESIEQLLEDGTLPFLSIASIRHGFKIIDMLTISAINRHSRSLATYTRNAMVSLKHENGADVCTLYGSNMGMASPPDLGPIIAFNLRRTDGSWFGYREVEKLASLSGIQLRTGCFCNPGACAKSLGLSHSELLSNIEAGHVCWDDYDILNGKPTGAVRISFGYMSTFEDAEEFLKFLVTSFVAKPNLSKHAYPFETRTPYLSEKHLVGGVCLQSITIYPVKSCTGFSVESWPLSNTGLLFDREWLLKGPSGEILTQKKVPEMCHIRTFIDLQKEKLYVESPHSKTKLLISLQKNTLGRLKEEMDIYGQSYEVQNYGNEVNLWFTEALARPCTFVRCMSSRNRCRLNKGGIEGLCREIRSKLNFANEAQLLLISEGSVNDLNSRLMSTDNQKGNCRSEQHTLVDAMRFRPNLVVSGAEPFAEDNWNSLHIGKAHFTSHGGCNRCQMINIDQHSGQTVKPREPLRTLASYRRVQGKILFGVLLKYESTTVTEEEISKVDEDKWLHVGQEVYPSMK